MKFLSSSLLFMGSLGLVFLGACNNATQVTNPGNNSAVSPSETATETTNQPNNQGVETATGHSNENQGGQVIETGKYHLELIALPEKNGTHLDFYLQEGANHKAISNAKVTAEVQSPTGSQKTLNLAYDAAGKHYAALLPEQTPGEYKVVVLSEINGEKVNGRFTFKR